MQSTLNSTNTEPMQHTFKRTLQDGDHAVSAVPRKRKKSKHDIQLHVSSDDDADVLSDTKSHAHFTNKQPTHTHTPRTRCFSDDITLNFKSKMQSRDPLHLKADLQIERNVHKNIAIQKRQSMELSNNVISPSKQVKRKRSSLITRTPLRKSVDIIPPKQPDFKHKQNNRQKDQRYIHGNYSRYYGYRNPEIKHDCRLDSMSPEWFAAKEVLDIGCNSGKVTLEIAEKFKPLRITGVDIDSSLIHMARRSIRQSLSKLTTKTTPSSSSTSIAEPSDAVSSSPSSSSLSCVPSRHNTTYPISMELLYGPIAAHPVATLPFKFPHNVVFNEGNYVPSDLKALENVMPAQYDTILALSITKWIHLNNGDDGLKRFFKKIFLQLKPRGIFVLEPQPWQSYTHKKNLTAKISYNFKNIKLKPTDFKKYLLSSEIGFSEAVLLDRPFNKSKGFRRELYKFTKGAESKANSTTTTTPTTPTPPSHIDANRRAHVNPHNQAKYTEAAKVNEVTEEPISDVIGDEGECSSVSENLSLSHVKKLQLQLSSKDKRKEGQNKDNP